MNLEMACTCGRKRLGIPGDSRVDHAAHPCPYSVIVGGNPACDSCSCCPACTVLCLPLKARRYRDAIAASRGEAFASVYDSALGP